MQAGNQRRILHEQRLMQRRELWPQRAGLFQILALQRKLFHADKMQMLARLSLLLPQLPGTEKIQTGTETGFRNGETAGGLPVRPALRQIILF